MTKLLDQAIDAAQRIPESSQDCVGQFMLDLIQDEARWDAAFSDPRSEKLLEAQAAEVRAQIAAGKVTDFFAEK
ncbi:MAG: hypothetical protein GKR94_11650 [Gammaproteobacteria bacterium]|nr:hypothetical protein [Gammaproteobacteria bacterium]